MMPIGARLHSAFQQMVYAHGYDHNFVLNQRPGEGMRFAARAYDPRTGRIIDCFTTEPGLQVYTSNGMNGSVVGSSGTLSCLIKAMYELGLGTEFLAASFQKDAAD